MARETRQTVEIGIHMPAWLPPRFHVAARVVLGTVIGALILFYAIAMAQVVNRLLWALQYGGPEGEIAFDVAYVAVMVGAAFVLRHVLKRGRAKPEAEM